MKHDDSLELFEQLIEIANADTAKVSSKYKVPKYVINMARDSHPGLVVNENYPYDKKLSGTQYYKEKAELQIELAKLQNWVKATGQRIIILFEGRDAAGKGGAIRRITAHINPRHYRKVALPKPTEEEEGQWYFQRYVNHLPAAGERS